jgi:hypothetical protein
MPVISFSTMRDKILSGEKKQTIRPYSEHWMKLKTGDKLVGWWKQRSPEREKLFESVLSEAPFGIYWLFFTDSLMQRDGFYNLDRANAEWFIPHYGEHGEVDADKPFVVIRWV